MKTLKPLWMTAAATVLAVGLHTTPVQATKVVVIPAGHTVVTYVPMRVARTHALGRMPGWKLRSERIVQRSHRTVYVYELFHPRQPGLTLVTVDARTGKVIDVTRTRRR